MEATRLAPTGQRRDQSDTGISSRSRSPWGRRCRSQTCVSTGRVPRRAFASSAVRPSERPRVPSSMASPTRACSSAHDGGIGAFDRSPWLWAPARANTVRRIHSSSAGAIRMLHSSLVLVLALAFQATARPAQDAPSRKPLAAVDLFQLELASDPQISPDGERIVYVRRWADDRSDRWRGNLWLVPSAGGEQRALTTGARSDGSPRWSPDGGRLAFVSSEGGSAQLWVRWMESGESARLTNLAEGPANLAWSPDGKQIAFTAFVEERPEPFVTMPRAPEGAQWAKPATVITQVHYRADGEGYLRQGHTQLFVVPADGGTPRALSAGPYDVRGPLAWTPDGSRILFASNRHSDAELDSVDTEIWEVALANGELRALTDRRGPDHSPAVSPDGKLVAYLGFDDRRQGYQVTRAYVVPLEGGTPRELAP